MRYVIGFMACREGQRNDTRLFETNSVATARPWFEMGFRVFDRHRGRQIHVDIDFHA